MKGSILGLLMAVLCAAGAPVRAQTPTPIAYRNAPTLGNTNIVGAFTQSGGAVSLTGATSITGALTQSGGAVSLTATAVTSLVDSGAASVGGTLTTTGAGGIVNTYGLTTATAAVNGAGTALVVTSSASIGGQLYVGYSQVTNACGAGVVTCTASCPANTAAIGCGNCAVAAVAGLSVSTGGTSTTAGCTCTALAATTITAYSFCARLNN